MDAGIIGKVNLLNPWLKTGDYTQLFPKKYTPRQQIKKLLLPQWDEYCTVLIGPRQSGKTTLGKMLCYELICKQKRFEHLIYLNCDLLEMRTWMKDIQFVSDIFKEFKIKELILFIDEVQRLENPGLLLKAIVDLSLPIKLIASGSSQIELKSKIKEHLTGRKFESFVLPLSQQELQQDIENWLIYGSYPKVITSEEKKIVLSMLYNDYIKKDIIEILKVGKPDILEKIIGLIGHTSGQIVNEHQIGIDCKSSNSLVKNYLSILENSYVISKVTPFSGNKRAEITSRPKYYFIDNGFRNQSLENFLPLSSRQDKGLLVEGAIFQELLKYREQNYLNYRINFWRTKGGAEVDFILSYNEEVLPIEVKYQNIQKFKVSKSFRSFIEAYEPKVALIITNHFKKEELVNNTLVKMIPLSYISLVFKEIDDFLKHHHS